MEAIQSSARAFVALCRNGRVVAWGDPSGGGDLRPVAHELYVPLAVVPQHGWGLIFCGNFYLIPRWTSEEEISKAKI